MDTLGDVMIRKLGLIDFKQFCLPIIKQTMPNEVYQEAVETLLDPQYLDKRTVYGIVIDEKIVSFSGYICLEDKYYITWTATHPDYQGKGYCSKLFEYFLPEIPKDVMVETYEHPCFYSALIFYRKQGFKFCGFVPDHLSDGSSVLYLRRRNETGKFGECNSFSN
jgi:ribosomal protein S18 acetylase RimI-like enzyme